MKALVLTLQPKTSIKLPFAHMKMVQGLLYKQLAYNNKFLTEVHNRQIDNHSVYKLFCFSDIQGKYKRITKYKSTIINAWLGKFSLTAEPAMLFTAYYCGIVSKNSMGFGMITAES